MALNSINGADVLDWGTMFTCPFLLAGDRTWRYLGARRVHVAHCVGVPMSRSLVGPFAVVSAAVSAFVASAHDHRVSLTIVDAATAAPIASEKR